MAPDWTTPEYLSHIIADELESALRRHRIHVITCDGDEDGSVSVALSDLTDAETMMTLVTDGDGAPGSLYDRATGSCVALSDLARIADETGEDLSDRAAQTAVDAGWDWQIHPHMTGRRMGWHVTVTIPSDDANTVTATLNAIGATP